MKLDAEYNLANTPGSWKMGTDDLKFHYVSKGSKPAKGFPLFIFLHGSGESSTEEWNSAGSWCEYFQDSPSLYFIPRSPLGGTNCRWYPPTRQQIWERVIRQAYLSDNVNPNKIYFAGISEGAYGTQRLASFYADYLAGAGPIAGGDLLADCPPENCANLAFCLQTGANDTMYGRSRLTQRAKDMWAGLAAAHPGYYTNKIDLQPGADHAHTDYTVTTPWLVRYERKPNPKYVYWENFGMGNILGESYTNRSGFHNLHVIEGQIGRTADKQRDCYEMTIDGNNIDLKVSVVSITETGPVSEDGWTKNLDIEKSYTPAAKGRVRIYLNSDLVDLSKPVTVTVNGKQKFSGTVTLDARRMVESCAEFFDPTRLFPAAIDVAVN